MKRFLPAVPAFGAGLVLAVGPGLGDTWLPAAPLSSRPSLSAPVPWALTQAPTRRSPGTNPRVVQRPSLTLPRVQPPRGPGDVFPHCYMIYGLRTGPGGMACTDRNGAVIPMPFSPQITTGPYTARPILPQILPPAFVLPRRAPSPAPKK